MRQILRLELKRAFFSRGFLISLAIGGLIVILHMFFGEQCVLNSYEFNKMTSELENFAPHSVWLKWMGLQASAMSFLYFSIVPVLAAIPHAASGWLDIKSGYQKQIVMRVPRKQYFIAKYTAVYVSGGCVVVLPLFFDFLLCHLFLPSYTPLAAYGLSVTSPAIGSALFYTHPYLYVLLYLVLVDFLFGGAYACMALATTYLFENIVLIEIFPYIFQTVIMFLCGFIPYLDAFFITKLNPAQPYAGNIGILHYMINFLVYFLLSYVFYMKGGKYREIYR